MVERYMYRCNFFVHHMKHIEWDRHWKGDRIRKVRFQHRHEKESAMQKKIPGSVVIMIKLVGSFGEK